MDGQILSLILALSKKQALKYGSVGIIGIYTNATGDRIIFELANGTKQEIECSSLNYMKLDNYDKDKDGIIDLADVANFAKESDKSRNTLKFNGKESNLFFQKDIDTTDDLTEGAANKFLKPIDKSKLDNLPIDTNTELENVKSQTNINKLDIENLKVDNTKNRNDINQLQNDVTNKKDELVKLNSSDTADYLENKIDSSSIQIKNNKLIVKSLDGLEVTVAELNMLKGIKDNIQKMIDLTQKGMQFRGFVNTYEELTQIPNAEAGYTSIVRTDEKSENKKMFYIYDGLKWQPTYEVSADNMGRDFIIEPLDLMVETKGVLPENKIDENIARKTDVNNKIDKVASATQDNIAILNSDGSLKDSNNKLSDYAKTNHIHQELEDKMALKTDLHNHINKDTLNKLTTSEDGKLLFNGNLIEGSSSDGTGISTWNKFEL